MSRSGAGVGAWAGWQGVAALALACLCLAPGSLKAAGQAATAPAPRAGIGLNLAPWEYHSTDFPLVDQFKRSTGWLTQCEPSRDRGCSGFAAGASAWDTGERAQLALDAEGWPLRLPAADDSGVKFRSAAVLLFNGNGGAHPAGRYVVTYEGRGTLVHDLAGRKLAAESRPGRDVVEVGNRPEDGGWRISLQATDRAQPLRRIRVFPPGGACASDLGSFAATPADCVARRAGAFVPFEKFPAHWRWHPQYLQDLRGMRVLRFMDWGRTNASPVTSWASRPPLDTAVWDHPGGVPVEAMLDLAAAVGADPWLNLPLRADDGYARGLGQLLRERLPPGRTAVIEHANEPWNEAFPIAAWVQQAARAKWPAASAQPVALGVNWQAWRAARLCQLVKSAWAPGVAPVKCVLNGQAANPDLLKQTLGCPLAAAELGGPCARQVDALAVAPYFGGYLASPALRETTRGWLADADGGVDHVFQELLGTDRRGAAVRPPLQGRPDAPREGGALAQARGWMQQAHALAATHGLPLWAYEGGQHLTPPAGEDEARWVRLIQAANRDPRMGVAYERYLSDWRASGGELVVLYHHMGAASKWGAWGLKEHPGDAQAPKWQVVRRWRDSQPCWWKGCGT